MITIQPLSIKSVPECLECRAFALINIKYYMCCIQVYVVSSICASQTTPGTANDSLGLLNIGLTN